jgi:hypothetical protein
MPSSGRHPERHAGGEGDDQRRDQQGQAVSEQCANMHDDGDVFPVDDIRLWMIDEMLECQAKGICRRRHRLRRKAFDRPAGHGQAPVRQKGDHDQSQERGDDPTQHGAKPRHPWLR